MIFYLFHIDFSVIGPVCATNSIYLKVNPHKTWFNL
jgi:hypothetical protein